MKRIECDADLAEGGFAALITLEPAFARVQQVLGCLPLRRRTDGFGALMDAIVGGSRFPSPRPPRSAIA